MVDRELFERFEAALGANASMFSEAIRELADAVDGMSEQQLRAYLVDNYYAIVRAYGTVAAEAAREFYAEQRAISGVADQHGEYEAVTSYPEWLESESAIQANSVAATAGEVVANVVYGYLEAHGMRSVMGCADSTLDYNASRDPAHPKWALVPHPGACAWCVMLGSRGFAYQSERTVGASRHNRCKCTPIVDFDTENPKLKGYSPEKLLKKYEAREKSGETSFRQRRPKKTRRYEGKKQKRTVSAQASHHQADKLIEYLSKAESVEDFKLRAIKADEQWRASKHEGNSFKRLKSSYVDMAKKWGVNPNKKPNTARGAVYGAVRGDRKREQDHANAYYDQVRNRDRDVVIKALGKESGLSKSEMEKAFKHLLIEEHDLDDGRHRFYPDYEMSQSMQRLLEGKNIQEHDRIMFKHEHLESVYMNQGFDQRTAHEMANMEYNYEQALDRWLSNGAKV